MTGDEIREELRRVPFKPFRIVLTTNERYDVRHPDLIMVGTRSLAIGIANDPEGTKFDRLARIDLLHIVRIEELSPSAKINGQAGSTT